MKSLHRVTFDALSLEESWNILDSHGIEVLYGTEEKGGNELFVNLSPQDVLHSFSWIIRCEPYQLPDIDWDSQWELHGENYHDGYIHVDLSKYKKNAPIIRLKAGPGFGDLFHPTTRLVLELLSQVQQHQLVVDIGSGSGILTLAAVALGAPYAYGIDIDTGAIEHSKQNAMANGYENKCRFLLPEDFNALKETVPHDSLIITLNMIQSEQQIAWASLPHLYHQEAFILTSGIREEGRNEYLKLTQNWGWELKQECQEEEWLAFLFFSNNK